MKTLNTRLATVFLFIGFFSMASFSQVLKSKAEEHPLETVFYLLSKTDKNSKEEQKACLAKSFTKAGKFSEIEKTAEMVKWGSYVDNDLITVAEDLIKAGKLAEASRYVSYLVKRSEDDSDNLEKLFEYLIRLERDDEALKIAAQFRESEKVDGAFEIARVYLELEKREKALTVIENISKTVEKSEYDRDKARLALFYARLGKEEKALKVAGQSLEKVVWTTGIPKYDDARIIDYVFEAYLLLGKYELAGELLEKQGKTEETKALIQIAKSYLARGDRKKADEYLNRSQNLLNPAEYGDSFDLGDLIEIYLVLGEIEKAQNLAKNLTGSEYMRQGELLKVADFYIKKQDKKTALEILNFALEQTRKINTDEEESGMLWTSAKWDQARYQSQIAIKLIDMQFDRQALDLISQIKKPYLKALLLTEFFAVNKKRQPAAKLRPLLEQALSLLRTGKEAIFDSNKYDVYAIVAHSFAEIGLADKANNIFAEVLSKDKEMVEKGLDSYLLVAMCKIGVEFENSGIKPNEKLKASLRNIIKNWEDDEY